VFYTLNSNFVEVLMNAIQKLCANGGTIAVTVNVSDQDFDFVSIQSNVSVALFYEGDRVAYVRGSLKTFASTGNMVLDMANTRNQKFPNSAIDGVDDLINAAFVKTVYDGLKAEGKAYTRGAFRYDAEAGDWTGADMPTTGLVELDEDKRSLAATMVSHGTARKLAKVADQAAGAAQNAQTVKNILTPSEAKEKARQERLAKRGQ